MLNGRFYYKIKNGEIIRYFRSGKCLKCGECCKRDISYRMFLREVRAVNGSFSIGWNKRAFKSRDGWVYFQYLNCWWAFKVTFCGKKSIGCSRLNGKVCEVHGRDNQPAICKLWPFDPEINKCFPKCGYKFKRVGKGYVGEEE